MKDYSKTLYGWLGDAVFNVNFMDVNGIINLLTKELEADSKLAVDDPNKRNKKERDKLIGRILRLEEIRLRRSKNRAPQSPTGTGISRNGVPLGRPRKDLNPESEGKAFIRQVSKAVVNGEEVDWVGDSAAGKDQEPGQA